MRSNATATAEAVGETTLSAIVPAGSGRTASWHWPARLATVGTGHLLYGLFNHAFDYLLYPWAVYTLGLVTGGIVMTALSALQCAATLLLYERMRLDWVGASLLEVYARSAPESLQARAIGWLTGRQRWLAFAALCALTDPFIVTAFFRGGRFGPLGRRDWQLFFASVLVCNAYWIFVADLIAQVAVAVGTTLLSLFQMLTGVTA